MVWIFAPCRYTTFYIKVVLMAVHDKLFIGPVAGHTVFLTAYSYWAEVMVELTKWCIEHNSYLNGSVVTFPDDETMALFILRWT